MKVVDCGPELAGRWDDFVATNSEGCFYHLYGWSGVNEKSFGHRTHFLAAMEGGEILGVLPLVYLRSRIFGRLMCSMPFVNYGGICAVGGEAEEALLEEAVVLAAREAVRYVELRGTKRFRGDLPTSENKVSMTVRLEADPEGIWRSYKTKHRTNIRRAYKNGFSTVWGGQEYLDEFYDVLSDSWRSLGTPIYGKDYFRNIMEAFPGNTAIFIVRRSGRPAAAAFNGYYRKTVEGMWAGVKSASRRLQPSYVLYWDMIRHACREGFERYHFGRSTVDSGGEHFKQKWNMERRQLYWQYHLGRTAGMPRLNVGNPRFRFAIRAWQRMPVGMTRILGPLVAGSIP